MKLRTLIVTIAVLAVLCAIIAFVRRPSPPASTDARLNQPLVDRAAVEKATKLRLSDAGKTVELARQPDGTWRVPSYFDLPADFTKLTTLVGSLTDAKLQRLVTTTPERIARLEFKDTKISLLDDADKEVWSVTLGKNAEAGGRYVRFGSEQKAYLTNFQAWLDAEPKNWADTTLIAVKPEEVSKVELSFPDGEPVVFSRAKKEDPWSAAPTPPNQTVNSEKIGSMLNALGSLRFSETTALDDASAMAAKAHQRTVKLTTFDGKTVQVTLGRKPEEKKLKPPAASLDGKSGPGTLGSLKDLTAQDAAPKTGENPATPDKPIAPEFETIPAGPVFASVTHSDANAPVNALMQKRAVQVSDYVFTSLPKTPADLFSPAAPSPASNPTVSSPAEAPKS